MNERDRDNEPNASQTACTHAGSERSELEEMFARAMRRARSTAGKLISGPALAGAMVMSTPGMVACTVDGIGLGETARTSWVQDEGQRNTAKVSYLGAFWSKCTNPNTRFGSGSCDIWLKLRVQPTPGALIEHKEVGVVYRHPADPYETTAHGYYFTTWDNGDEEWHVKVTVPSTRDLFVFQAFYRDGAFNTYYDDNQGENHVVNNGPGNQVVEVHPWASTVAVTDAGVEGKIRIRLADLDYDKEVALIATIDGWETVIELGQGLPGDINRFFWVQDVYGGELWEIYVDLPGENLDAFEYSVVYRHGVVNDATVYEYWANNGGYNYRVEREPIVVE